MIHPTIIGFVCNWSFPADTDIEGSKEIQGYPKIHLVRVMCVGRIDPVVLLDAFVQGVDGVLVVGCPSTDCHYVDGNVYAGHKVNMVKKLLSLTGLEPQRLRLEAARATDVEPFVRIVDDFRDEVAALGPSCLAEKRFDEKVMLSVLAAKNAAGDVRLRTLAGREQELTEAGNAYGEIMLKSELGELLDEIVKEEFTRHKISLLARQEPLSVKEFAATIDMTPASILRHIVDLRRKGVMALHHIKGTTPFYKTLRVQQDD